MKAKLRKLHVVFICIVSFLLVWRSPFPSRPTSRAAIDRLYLPRPRRSDARPAGRDGKLDTNYYEPQFSTKEETVENGENVTRELCEEGFVLLKNQDNALPLDAGETISLIGRGAVDPLYGGLRLGQRRREQGGFPLFGHRTGGLFYG